MRKIRSSGDYKQYGGQSPIKPLVRGQMPQGIVRVICRAYEPYRVRFSRKLAIIRSSDYPQAYEKPKASDYRKAADNQKFGKRELMIIRTSDYPSPSVYRKPFDNRKPSAFPNCIDRVPSLRAPLYRAQLDCAQFNQAFRFWPARGTPTPAKAAPPCA